MKIRRTVRYVTVEDVTANVPHSVELEAQEYAAEDAYDAVAEHLRGAGVKWDQLDVEVTLTIRAATVCMTREATLAVGDADSPLDAATKHYDGDGRVHSAEWVEMPGQESLWGEES